MDKIDTIHSDLEYLKNISNHDDKLMKDLLEKYIEITPGSVENMRNAFNQKNWKKLAGFAHEMQSSIGIMGIHTFRDELKMLEKNAEKEKDLKTIPELIAYVEKSNNEVVREFQKICNLLDA